MTKNPHLKHITADDFLFEKIGYSPIHTIKKQDTVESVIPLLADSADTYSDALVVIENSKIIGCICGDNILGLLSEDQNNDFFKQSIESAINYKIAKIDENSTLLDLLDGFLKAGRAFAVVESKNDIIGMVSAKDFVTICANSEMKIRTSDIPLEKIITYSKTETVKQIISKMMQNQKRRLLLEGTDRYTTDRWIFKAMLQNPIYQENVDLFLNENSSILHTEKIKIFNSDMNLNTLCKMMYGTSFPCAIVNDNLITPWDVVKILGKYTE